MKRIMKPSVFLSVILSFFLIYASYGQDDLATTNKKRSFPRNFPTDWWTSCSTRSNQWYQGEEARTIADNIITWQTSEGGWPLMNTTNEPWTGDENAIGPWGRTGTLIYATTNEIRFLSRIFTATNETNYKHALIKGINYIFLAQTPTGGWPKAYPVSDYTYKQHITFNDGCMENALSLLKELITKEEYSFLDPSLIELAEERYNLGIQCILKCQIVSDSKLTGWCQQHDAINYQPRPGRSFEPAAISGSESIGIIKLLMQIENPSLEIRKAIEGAVNWINRSKIDGFKVVDIPDTTFALRGIDRILVTNPNSTIWARYYDIESNRPIFVGRDGVRKYNLSEIDQERRTGYAWYGKWGSQIENDYSAWAEKRGIDISEEALRNKPEDGYFITSDSIRIHYLTKGNGSPVILIHGLSATAYGNWYTNGIADSLAKKHLVVALDCRNHGLSGKPAGNVLAWGSENDIIELMDHLKIKKAHFHGYSMGGALIGQLMARTPERFITASMGGYGIPETDSTWIAKMPEDKKGADPQAKEAYHKLLIAYALSKGMTQDEAEEFAITPRPNQKRLIPPPLKIDLTEIDYPVMTIMGEFDRPIAKSHRMKREIKNFKHVTLAGKSHNTAIMAGYMPPLYIIELMNFIDQHDK